MNGDNAGEVVNCRDVAIHIAFNQLERHTGELKITEITGQMKVDEVQFVQLHSYDS